MKRLSYVIMKGLYVLICNLKTLIKKHLKLKTAAAEISDYATNPDYRGHGLMRILTSAIEDELKRSGIISIYSLARAISRGMNSALYKCGYTYRGKFINNCHICGKFEDMNLWTKD
ncbi:MAG: beta-lysine N6-acetyltransferase [Clostridia bacterium]|nr:beta-lysine N6-acetyltransferase [Clostridia bacterium]